jgi:glycerol kinase
MKYVGAIDQGTTSTRFILFNKKGQIIDSCQKEHEQIFPKAGWVEHNPEEIWSNTKYVIEETLRKSGIKKEEIAAIGITNQRETTVLWNSKTGEAYYNAIVWQDTRVDNEVKKLKEAGHEDKIKLKTGLPLATYFSGLKIKWILENANGIKQGLEKNEVMFGNMDTYVLWKMTGEFKTDVTNASRTQLMNLESLTWDDELLEILDIPKQILPQICASSEIFGESKEVLAGIKISGILGDQQAALVGQTCFEIGDAKNTYGTGCFMLMNTGTQIVPSKYGLLTTVAYKFGNDEVKYALEGSVAIAGALVQWLRDNLGIIEKSSDIEYLASKVEDNGGCYFVPAFSGLYAPYWQADARGTIVGMTRYTNKNHIAKAALEATCYQTMEVLEAMEKDSGKEMKSLQVDGGMTVNEDLMQFQASMVGVNVTRPKMIETTALGAAYAAGLAVGYWKDLNDLKQNWEIDKVWTPKLENETKEKYKRQWKKAIEKSMNWE